MSDLNLNKHNFKHSQSNRFVLPVLMMTLIIDMMGMGLVFPILPNLFFSPHSAILSSSLDMLSRKWLYGFALCVWPFGMFFGNAIVGTLSDRFGRKPMLLFCLMGMSLTYALGWLSISISSASLFILSRFLNGACSGSFVLAQSSIVDISTEKNKARNIGWVTLAACLGFVIGPVAASFVLDILNSIWSPLMFATGLGLINFILVFWILPSKTSQIMNQTKKSFFEVLFAFKVMLIDKRIRVLGLIFFLLQAAWGFYVQDIEGALQILYHYSAGTLGLFIALGGFGPVLNILFFQPYLIKRFSAWGIAIVSAGIFAILMLLIPSVSEIGQWVMMLLASSVNILLYTAIITLISDRVNPDEQGHILGCTGALFGIAWFLNALFIGWLMHYSILLPVYIGGILLALSVGLFSLVKKS